MRESIQLAARRRLEGADLMAELLPCPFCGKPAAISGHYDLAHCGDPECYPGHLTFALPDGWNRRAAPAGYVPASEVQKAREEALASLMDCIWVEVGECVAGHNRAEISPSARRKIEAAIKKARARAAPPANGEE